jgi:hypothetical protein
MKRPDAAPDFRGMMNVEEDRERLKLWMDLQDPDTFWDFAYYPDLDPHEVRVIGRVICLGAMAALSVSIARMEDAEAEAMSYLSN